MQTPVKGIPQLGIALLIKVVLVDRERLLTLPFHVLNQAPQSLLNLLLAFSRLVNIPDQAGDERVRVLDGHQPQYRWLGKQDSSNVHDIASA